MLDLNINWIVILNNNNNYYCYYYHYHHHYYYYCAPLLVHRMPQGITVKTIRKESYYNSVLV